MPGRPPGRLIVQDDGDRLKVFELGTGRGGKSLPIFSFEEEEAAPSFEPAVSAMSSMGR